MLVSTRAVWNYRHLLRSLVTRDLRVKYKGSTLGVAWSLLHPLLMAAVYTFAFRRVLNVQIEHFPIFLLSGLLPWMFTSTALSAATGAIADNGGLVRKVAFPRAILPLGAIGAQFVQFLLTYAMLVALALLTGIRLSPAALATLAPLLVLQLVFTTGLGLALSTAHVYFRDTRHLLEVLLQIWFWGTPIVYSLSLVPGNLRPLVLLNPMAHFITAYHGAILDGAVPDAAAFSILVLVAVTALVAGFSLFSRFESRFAELV